jgi:hypothetical protein
LGIFPFIFFHSFKSWLYHFYHNLFI